MEPAIIVEGFMLSQEMYGVKYVKMIADGDSSVYHNVLEARPYDDITVQKVECRNHLLRNYSNKLREVATTSMRVQKEDLNRGVHLQLRRVIGSRVFRLRAAVTKAIAYRKNEEGTLAGKTNLLKKDILNGPSHVFGEHRLCQEIGYFCNGPKENEKNYVPEMIKYGIYSKVMDAVGTLVDNSHHLILDVDSNVVEHYNSSVARFTGGKRVNFTQKHSYKTRCAAAVVSHNNRRPYYSLHKVLLKCSPGDYSKLYENRTKRKSTEAALRNTRQPKARRSLTWKPPCTGDKDYGLLSNKPDMDSETFVAKKEKHMRSLLKSDEERTKIEESTREQCNTSEWFEERRIRLTASNFGLVCNRKPHSNCAPVVSKILYSTVDCAAVKYGRLNEKTALKELAEQCQIEIKPCGLFIDVELPFLAATPDGLIDDDGIVEVKCPSTGVDLTPDELIKHKKGVAGSMWKKDGNMYTIKRKHNYHLQIQGQLHITRRKYCLFGIWTPSGLKVERINRDDELWEKEMKDKLMAFYMNCLLPEIIDPRRRRSMAIREPDHILKAQEERQNKKPA